MARDEEIERRLNNWARWRAGMHNPLGYAAVDLTAIAVGQGDRYREASIPVMGAEAAETDEGIRTLPSELRRTIEVQYLEGGSVAKKARKLCCAEATLYARIDQAHRLLRRWVADRVETRRREAERVQRLQREALG